MIFDYEARGDIAPSARIGPFRDPGRRGPHPEGGFDPVALRIGGEIRRWRHLRGHSVTGLARAVGVSHSTVSRWESGQRRPTLPHLIALGRIFGAGARTLIPE